jgi:hypothetical protein
MFFRFILVSVLVAPQILFADVKAEHLDRSRSLQIKPDITQVVLFNQTLDLNLVEKVVNLPATKLQNFIASFGVEIKKVKVTGEAKRVFNPIIASAPEASEQELEAIVWSTEYEGRFVEAKNLCCDLAKDTIFLREDALTYTLIHQFLYSQIDYLGQAVPNDVEKKYNLASRTHDFRFHKLFENPLNMLNPLWRRDIMSAQLDLVMTLNDRIRVTQAQEVIIELTLFQLIKPGNPYYNEVRQEEGVKYVEAMINNAITVFNSIHYSLDWTRNTLTELYEAIKKEDIIVREEEKISDEDFEAFLTHVNRSMMTLEPIKNEILNMKQVYTQITGRK